MDHFGPFLPKNFHERRLYQFSNIPIIYHQAKKKKPEKKTRLIPELTERQTDSQSVRQTDRQTDTYTDSQTDRQRAVTLYDSP